MVSCCLEGELRLIVPEARVKSHLRHRHSSAYDPIRMGGGGNAIHGRSENSSDVAYLCVGFRFRIDDGLNGEIECFEEHKECFRAVVLQSCIVGFQVVD